MIYMGRRTVRCEADDVTIVPIKKCCGNSLEVVVGGDVVEDGLLCLQQWQVPPPRRGLCLGQSEACVLELNLVTLDFERGDLACQVFGDTLLQFHLRPATVQRVSTPQVPSLGSQDSDSFAFN